jgi:AraC-like DNA-binding protein
VEAIPLERTTGILNPKAAETKFRLGLYPPSADLAFFMDSYWTIRWDLTDQPPFTQEVITYPCVNLVFERNNTRVWGVDSGKFARTLEGKGQVFGMKFRPGAFYPFLKSSISALTDRSIFFSDFFGFSSEALEEQMHRLSDEAMREVTENFLRERLPERDKNVELLNEIVICIRTDPSITRVDDVVERFNLNKRSLQRLFNLYIGGSPKWLIQRCRLQEAADQLLAQISSDYAEIALRLGYFDQAHFIKDFKAVIGKSPAEYAKSTVER